MNRAELDGALKRLESLENRIFCINHAMGLLNVDHETIAPADASAGIGRTLACLGEFLYETTGNQEAKQLLADLSAERDRLDPATARRVYLLNKDAERRSKIPQEEQTAMTILLNEVAVVWKKAKATNDFALLVPYFEKVLETTVRFTGYTDPGMDPYNALLNQYEEGLSTDMLDPFFESLRQAIVPLLHRCMEKGQIDNSFLHKEYPIAGQRIFSDYLMEKIGVDKNRCILGETEHPFTSGFSSKDVRITTNYGLYDISDNMYSVIHEGGHAMYEMNVNPDYDYTSLAGGASMSIHESQSRFYENLIGRSRPFIESIFPDVQRFFPEQLEGVTAEMFYRAVNRTEPSLIRTEADELTYCLHIMVRYELEKELVAGRLAVKDLPAAWNAKYQEYLGISVPDDTHGVLQDMHWPNGLIGYFPSYALGSAYGAQMLHFMEQDIPDLWTEVRHGNLAPVHGWLREHIHQYGALYAPTELFEKACGKFDPKYYIDYLTRKYESLYGI